MVIINEIERCEYCGKPTLLGFTEMNDVLKDELDLTISKEGLYLWLQDIGVKYKNKVFTTKEKLIKYAKNSRLYYKKLKKEGLVE